MQQISKPRPLLPVDLAVKNKLLIKRIEAKDWIENFSESAHILAFNEVKPKTWDRIDYALLVLMDDVPSAYMTCREWSHDTVYWQFGGVFPNAKNTIWSYKYYEALINWHRNTYDRCLTYIENTNSPMLKMAAKVGFKIIGVRNYHKSVMLEHLLEFTSGNK